MNGYNDNIHQQQIDKLVQLFPEVVTEGKIDWQKLQATLGEAVDLGERYGLGWKGKSDVFTTIQEKTVQTLHPDRANSVIGYDGQYVYRGRQSGGAEDFAQGVLWQG